LYFILITALCSLKYGIKESARYENKDNVKIYAFVGTINNLDGN